MHARTCEDQGIDQVYEACTFAAIATLLYRQPRLYEIMHADIQQWVNDCGINRFKMEDPAEKQCPRLPAGFFDYYRRCTGQNTIYEGNENFTAIKAFLNYSEYKFQTLSALELLYENHATRTTLQAWLKFPHLHDTACTTSSPGKKPDLCLIRGNVYLNSDDKLLETVKVLDHLHTACREYPAYGGIIATIFNNNDTNDDTNYNHAYAFTICNNEDFRICSRGECFGTNILDDPSKVYRVDDPLDIGKDRSSKLESLQFVLFCEKRVGFDIPESIFHTVLFEFHQAMKFGYHECAKKEGVDMGKGAFVSRDNQIMWFNSEEYNPGAHLESDNVLKQPVRVEYEWSDTWPPDIAIRCKKWQYTVNAICMCVCRVEEVEVENKPTLVVYFEELSLTHGPYMSGKQRIDHHTPLLCTHSKQYEPFMWPVKSPT